MPVQTQILTRRGTAASWTSTNPTLGAGEIGYETDTGRFKIGTGAAAWASLGYFNRDPLTTKGDLYTFSTTDDRLAVGANGETLVADSSTSTGLRYTGNYAAGKNKIINGDFGVWQRGTSFNITGGYTADRWMFDRGGSSVTPTISQQTFTPGTAPVAGYEGSFFYRYAQATAGTGQSYNSVAIQKIEDVRNFAGQTITVSAWIKADAARNFIFQIVRDYGSGGSGLEVTNSSSTLTTTTGWVRYSATFNIASLSGKTIGSGSSIWLAISSSVLNTAQTWDIWGVQVEAGSVATAFQTATGTIQGELSAAQRYFEKSYNTDVNPATSTDNGLIGGAGTELATTGGVIGMGIAFKVTKRVAPTVVVYDTDGNSNKVGRVRYGVSNTTNQSVTVSRQSNNGFVVESASGTSASTLWLHYTASAEL
jgi:hypothetical protein